MNNARRKVIQEALKLLDIGTLEQIKSDIENAQSEEQDFYDNMPEGIQAGDKGEKAQAAIDALGEIMDSLDTAIEALQEIEAKAEEATA